MVSTNGDSFAPESHPISDTVAGCCTDDFEASDEEACCQSDEDNLLDVSEPTDTEVRGCIVTNIPFRLIYL